MRRSPLFIALAILAVLPPAAAAKLTPLPGTGETPVGLGRARRGMVAVDQGSRSKPVLVRRFR
jgi:hypothetical protein